MARGSRSPGWRVQVAEHDVPPRWHVPARVVEVPAADAGQACAFVIGWAHCDAGVPPWRPFVRHSLAFTTAERVGEAPAPAPTIDRAQDSLFDRLAA